MPSTYRVSRAARIEAPPSAVYPHLVDLRRWVPWSPWEGEDPYTVRTWSGRESGVGAAYAWSGNREAGEGSMRIVAAEPDRRLDLELSFVRPFPATNTVRLDLDPESQGMACVLTMTMGGTLHPLLRALSRVMPLDRMVAKDLEQALGRLRDVVEESWVPVADPPLRAEADLLAEQLSEQLRTDDGLKDPTVPEDARPDVSPATRQQPVARSA